MQTCGRSTAPVSAAWSISPILVLTQVLSAVLLLPLPLLGFLCGISRNADVMREHVASRTSAASYLVAIALITFCVASLAVLSLR